MTRKKTTDEFVQEAKEIHGDKYDYTKFIYIDCKTKGIIICPKHGQFLMRPNNHTNKKNPQGCPKCGKENMSAKLKMTFETFIEKAMNIEQHKNSDGSHKYGYLHLKKNWKKDYKNQKSKISIYCNTCKIYSEQPSDDHLDGHGCRDCANITRGNKMRKPEEIFFKQCKEIHINEDGTPKYKYISPYTGKDDKIKYKYISPYTGKDDKIKYECPYHGEQEQIANDHLRGHGCPDCYFDTISERFILTKTDYLSKIEDLNSNLLNHYDFSNIPNNLKLGDEITIKCKYKNKDIKIKANTLLYERIHCSWCKYGRSKKCAELQEMLNQFIEKAMNIDKHKNPDGSHKYSYEKSKWNGALNYMEIYCNKCKKIFYQKPSNHLNYGCSGCCKGNYSYKQIMFLKLYSLFYNINIQHAENGGEYIISNSKYKADGYCKETNTIIEFHGDYWHGNPKIYNKNQINQVNKKNFEELYNKTIKKEDFIKEQGYNLVVIWEKDFDNLVNIVKNIQKKWREYKSKKK